MAWPILIGAICGIIGSAVVAPTAMAVPSGDTGGGAVSLLIFLGFYFLPSIIACARRNHNALAVFVLNLLVGWTIIGWIVALVWSFAKPAVPVIVTTATATTQVILPPAPPDGRRACPFCAEPIIEAAVVCRFCRRELPIGWAAPRLLR